MGLVSLSRRTDLPAFHGPWLLQRLRAGHCLVTNPFNRGQVRRVDLRPRSQGGPVDGLVFWTRRPGFFVTHDRELSGHPYYVQATLTAMPALLEPGLPAEADLAAEFRAAARVLGPERLVWRFDPLLATALTPPSEIAARFARLCAALAGSTRRVVVSLAELYPRVRRRLAARPELAVLDLKAEPGRAEELLAGLARTAQAHGLETRLCAGERDYAHLGIRPGRCVDPDIFRRAYGLDLDLPRDKHQRPACGCAESVDVGAYGTCGHGCLYCYATDSPAAALRRLAGRDPLAESLTQGAGGERTP